MEYQCFTCGKKINANDGRRLNLLAPKIRNVYPVLPRYANGSFHLQKHLSSMLETFMKTYGNGEVVSEMLHRAQASL